MQAAGSLALGPIRFGFQDGDSITARIWPAGRRRLLSLRNGSANTEPNKLSSQDFQRGSSLDTPLQAASQASKQIDLLRIESGEDSIIINHAIDLISLPALKSRASNWPAEIQRELRNASSLEAATKAKWDLECTMLGSHKIVHARTSSPPIGEFICVHLCPSGVRT